MKINSTYIPSFSIKETIKAISYIHNEIEKYFDTKLNPTFIELPAFYREGSPLLIGADAITRNITFDFSTSYNIGILPLFHSNWRRKMLEVIDAQPGESIKTEGHTIWRDIELLNTTTFVKDELTYAIVLGPNDNHAEKIKNITNELSRVIFNIATKIEEKFNIENIISPFWTLVDSQTLHTEMPNFTSLQKEEKILKGTGNFILENIGAKTIQGTIHSPHPPHIFDLHKQNTIIIRDRVNFLPMHVAQVSLYANGQVLSDQLKMFNFTEYLSLSFYKDIVNNKNYDAVELKINKSKLYMALLGKGNIAEVQANIASHEETKAAKKDKIEFI